MDPGYLIGSLAFFTIGSILLLSVVHFRQLLNNPEDRRHIDNILHDGKAATTVAAERLPRGTAVPLKTQLDRFPASRRPRRNDQPSQPRWRTQRSKGCQVSKTVHDAAPVQDQTTARQGETSGRMRWVLLASIGLTIAVFTLAAFGTSSYR